MPKRPVDPTSHEAIHGKKVKIGTGVGKRVGKRAKSAIEIRKAAREKLLLET